MSRGHRVGIALAAIALGLSFIVTGCSGDKALAPTAPKDYPVYFCIAGAGNWYFEYHPSTNRVDSFYVPFQTSFGIDVSADGTRLFIGGANSIAVVDLDSKTIIEELPYKGDVVVSPDNRWLAVTGQDVYILQASDYSVVLHDTMKTGWSGSFAPYSGRFYCPVYDSNGFQDLVLTIDFQNEPALSETAIPGGGVWNVIPSPDEGYWYLYLIDDFCVSRFQKYSPALGTVIKEDRLLPGHGEIDISPNGRYVFYSAPGATFIPALWGCDPPKPAFFVYDTWSNRKIEITTERIIEEPVPEDMFVKEMEITPDGRWLVAIDARWTSVVAAVDLTTMTVNKCVRLLGLRQFYSLTCQKLR